MLRPVNLGCGKSRAPYSKTQLGATKRSCTLLASNVQLVSSIVEPNQIATAAQFLHSHRFLKLIVILRSGATQLFHLVNDGLNPGIDSLKGFGTKMPT
jgi:hypothetical protein